MNKDDRKSWELNIGKFILEAGVVELRLLQLYWNITLNGNYDDEIKNASFSQKINRVRSEVSASGMCSSLKDEVLKTLKKCSEIVSTRNLVAHNPLSMDVYFDKKGIPKYEPLIKSLRKDTIHLTERDLIKDIDKIQLIIQDFSTFLSDRKLWSWSQP